MRLIDADALMADCQLAQKQAERHGREYEDAFYSCDGEISTEWWRVEDMIENAPTIEPKQPKGKWIDEGFYADGNGAHAFRCSECGGHIIEYFADPFCKWCGAEMEGR